MKEEKKVIKVWVTIRAEIEADSVERVKSLIWNQVGSIENMLGIRVNEIDCREAD